LVAFIVAEMREEDPMMPLGLFRSPTFAGANLLTLFLYAALSGLLFFLPFMLIQVSGYPPSEAGAALVPFVLTMFLLSRWAGGLVTKYGSKLPLIIGPLITAAGFTLFGILKAGNGSYWTAYFPAIMVMSLGMSISVAPLTTTVMGAVEERHAGIASGINNAVSRIAGLIAVAVFGVVLLSTFRSNLQTQLGSMNLTPDQQAQILSQGNDLLNLKIPEGVDPATADAIRAAVSSSFVRGFHVTTYASAGLAVLSAISAWGLIAGKEKSTR